MATYGIDFVNEDDARCVLFGLLEHVANAARADTDEHFNEVGTGNGEERHICLTRNRACQKRFTSSRGANQKHTARDLATKTLEFLRITQKFNDFFQILLGLIDTGDIVKRDTTVRFGQKLGFGFTEAHRTARSTLHLPHEEQPDAKDEEHRQQCAEVAQEPGGTVAFRPCDDSDILALQAFHQGIVDNGGIGLKCRTVFGVGSKNPVAGHSNVANPPGIHIAKKLRVRNFTRTRLRWRRLEHAEQCDQQQGNNCPQGEISEIWVHRTPRTHTDMSAVRSYVPLT